MKNKKIIFILLTFLFTVILQGCKKEWLEIRSSKGLVIPSTLSDAEAILNRTTIMNEGRTSPLGDIAAGDFIVPSSYWRSLVPWQANAYLWKEELFVDNIGLENWGNFYQQIYYANLVLEILNKIDKIDDQKKYNNVKGRALFFRSWAYYQLAQIYCLPYSEQNIGKPGLPLRDGTDLDVKLIRSTIGQTYLQMKNDVSESIQLLDETSINMYQPNRRAALMLLSRVNLIMADYKSALHNSDEAIKLNGELLNYNNLDLTKAYPFPDGNVEVVFYTSISYAQVMSAVRIDISPELLKEYSDNDLRKKGFFVLKNGLTNFKGSYTGPNGYFGGLATDELYLIRSECYLRSGDLDKSRADLNFLLSKRYKDFQPIADLSSDELLSRILLERRKELLLRGVAWTDLKRLNLHKNTERTVTKIVEGETYSLEPNSLRYAMPFPQVVVDLGSYAQ